MILEISILYFRVWSKRSESFHSRFRLYTEMCLLALDKVLKMIFLKGIFVLLTTGFLLTGKGFGFGMMRACDVLCLTEHVAIPSNAQFLSCFDLTLKLNLSHGRLLHQPGRRPTQMTYEPSSFRC